MVLVLLRVVLNEGVLYVRANPTYLVNFVEKTKPVMEASHWPSLATCAPCASVGLCQISPSNFKEKSANRFRLPFASLKNVLPSLWVNVKSCNDPWKKYSKKWLRLDSVQIHTSSKISVDARCLKIFRGRKTCPYLWHLWKTRNVGLTDHFKNWRRQISTHYAVAPKIVQSWTEPTR